MAIYSNGDIMKVLLIKDVKGLGKTGEVKEVKDGYGKNFLIGKGVALHATNEVLKKYESQQKKLKEQEAAQIAEAKEIAEKINSTKLTIRHKVGANGHLIGSVTNKEISEALKTEFNIEFDKKHIVLEKKIKSVGIFEVDCKLGHAIHGKLKIDIIEA